MTIKLPFNDSNHLSLFFDSHSVENFFSQNSVVQKDLFVYFARYGKTFDGHKLALRIIRSKNYIVAEHAHIITCFEDLSDQAEILNSKYYIQVDHVDSALIHTMKTFAIACELDFFSVGVTGTSGKTSIVQLVGQILNLLKVHVLKIGTLGIELGNKTLSNSHQTTPDYPTFIQALADARDLGIKTLVMEVSSHGLAQSRLDDYQFDIGIFTNFSQDHLDFHKTMDEYFFAKTQLFSRHLKLDGTCIISTQSEKWYEMVTYCYGANRTLYLLVNEQFSLIEEKISKLRDKFKNIYLLTIKDKVSSITGLAGRFYLTDLNHNMIANEKFSSQLIGDINFENLMSVFCICTIMHYPVSNFVPLFGQLTAVSGRMQRVGRNVFVDYSHKPGALESVLSTLRSLLPKGHKLITVFGCGGERDVSKRPLMGKIATEFSDLTIVTSDNPRHEDPDKIIRDIIAGVDQTKVYLVERDRKLAIEKAFQFAHKSDIILIAGKGHETYQQIGNQKMEFSDVKIAREFLGKTDVI